MQVFLCFCKGIEIYPRHKILKATFNTGLSVTLPGVDLEGGTPSYFCRKRAPDCVLAPGATAFSS